MMRKDACKMFGEEIEHRDDVLNAMKADSIMQQHEREHTLMKRWGNVEGNTTSNRIIVNLLQPFIMFNSFIYNSIIFIHSSFNYLKQNVQNK